VRSDRTDGLTRYEDVALPDRQPVGGVGGHRENLMKRKTLRRCDDGRLSVSESFTETESVEDGVYT